MKASIIKIGNSRGIRIPKPILKQCGFDDEVELEVRDNELIIRSPHKVREGWDQAFQSMSYHGDDQLLDEFERNSTSWDETNWEWK